MNTQIMITISILSIPVMIFIMVLFFKKERVKVIEESHNREGYDKIFGHSKIPRQNILLKLILVSIVITSFYFTFSYVNANIDIVINIVSQITEYIKGAVIFVGLYLAYYILNTDVNIIFTHSFIIFATYMTLKIIFFRFTWKSIIINIILFVVFMIAIYILKAFFDSPLHALYFILTGANDIKNAKYRR